jgi:Eukaryotic aspartyl protease
MNGTIKGNPNFCYIAISPSQSVVSSTYLASSSENSNPKNGKSQVVEDTTYILGDIFLRNYYLVLDFEQKKVGLALNFYSEGEIKWNVASGWIMLVIILVWFLILFGITFYVCHYKKKKDHISHNEIVSPLSRKDSVPTITLHKTDGFQSKLNRYEKKNKSDMEEKGENNFEDQSE